MTTEKVDLVQVIKENPGCMAMIDNDCWWILREPPENAPDEEEDFAAYLAWEKNNTLASSNDDVVNRGGGYGSGNRYGGDILQALAVIVGIRVESV